MDLIKAEREVQAKISKLKQIALQAAVSDGRMDLEESKLIEHIDKEIPELKRLAKEMFEDGVIHAHEVYLFQEDLKKLLEESLKIAQKDNKVEYGEQVILKKIREEMLGILNFVKQFEKNR